MKNLVQYLTEGKEPKFTAEAPGFGRFLSVCDNYNYFVVDTTSGDGQFYESAKDIVEDWGPDDTEFAGNPSKLTKLKVGSVYNINNGDQMIFKFGED